jgi:CheY-like chemotaxis protein
LFRPFSQADTSMTRKYGGTGLGLMLSMRLADLLGGGLTLVDSRVNHGSTFLATVRANLAALSESEEGKSSSPEKGRHEGTVDERFLAGIRILVAEDSPDNQTLIEHYLSGEGAIVEVANNGAEAFEKAVHGDFHVVLMDIQMPVVDGYNATQRLRRTGFDRPIIALTAHALKEERDRSLREGCNDHLTKPVNRRLLISTIGKYIYGERLTSTT